MIIIVYDKLVLAQMEYKTLKENDVSEFQVQ